jgi:hypothetical protein
VLFDIFRLGGYTVDPVYDRSRNSVGRTLLVVFGF